MTPYGKLSFWNVPDDADDPVVEVYVNGELVDYQGGGGEDLTTCTLTIIAPESVVNADAEITIAYIDTVRNCIKATGETIALSGDATYQIPLYKGKQIASHNKPMTMSGDISSDGEGWLYITGDCSITGW